MQSFPTTVQLSYSYLCWTVNRGLTVRPAVWHSKFNECLRGLAEPTCILYSVRYCQLGKYDNASYDNDDLIATLTLSQFHSPSLYLSFCIYLFIYFILTKYITIRTYTNICIITVRTRIWGRLYWNRRETSRKFILYIDCISFHVWAYLCFLYTIYYFITLILNQYNIPLYYKTFALKSFERIHLIW